jgi:hypothetical protein
VVIGGGDIVLLRVQPGGELEVTNLGLGVVPRFSPDGTRLAFFTMEAGQPRMVITELGDHQSKVVHTVPAAGIDEHHVLTQLAWSADGGNVAFLSLHIGDFQGTFDPWFPLPSGGYPLHAATLIVLDSRGRFVTQDVMDVLGSDLVLVADLGDSDIWWCGESVAGLHGYRFELPTQRLLYDGSSCSRPAEPSYQPHESEVWSWGRCPDGGQRLRVEQYEIADHEHQDWFGPAVGEGFGDASLERKRIAFVADRILPEAEWSQCEAY